MLSTLNIRSEFHNSCEDTVLVQENEIAIYGGIFDGCSSGINSHWASRTHAYIFSKYINPTDTRNIVNAFINLVDLKYKLGLDNEHFLSTCLLFHYDKINKILFVRCLGDGLFYVNDVEYDKDTNDKVNYLGDYLHMRIPLMFGYLDKSPVEVYENVSSFRICSDGIKRIETSQFSEETTDPLALLFKPPTSANYLSRMWNILKRKHFIVTDDLSIISYVQD